MPRVPGRGTGRVNTPAIGRKPMGLWKENGSRKQVRLEASLQRGKKEMASGSPLRSERRRFPYLPLSLPYLACGVGSGKADRDPFPSPSSCSWVLASAWGNSCSAQVSRHGMSVLTPALTTPSARELAPAGSCWVLLGPHPLLPMG